MTVRPALLAAVGVFRDLGWHKAAVEDAGRLPLGSAEQRKTALAGLRSGEWATLGEIGRSPFGWISRLKVDQAMLALFAVRLGIDAARTLAVLPARGAPDDVVVGVLADRGSAFCARFVRSACTSNRRPWEHALSAYGAVAVRLVHHLQLEIPDQVEYLKDWAALASHVLTGEDLYPASANGATPPEIVLDRLPEHLTTATTAGVPVTGPFGPVLVAAFERQQLSRPHALTLALTGLDAATRPGDRIIWTRFLLDTVAITDDELRDHTDALVAVLATGDAAVIEALGVRLIAAVTDDQLPDVATTALTVRTRKGLRTVLLALVTRPAPESAIAAEITTQIADLITADPAMARDKAVGKAVEKLHTAWSVAAPDPSDQAPEVDLRAWPPTPPLWQVPRLDLLPPAAERLTELAAELLGNPDPLTVELFLALANDLARTDSDAVRTALQGVPESWAPGLEAVHHWVRGRVSVHGLDRAQHVREPLSAREQALFHRLGAVPCLLSTPSTVDLRITVPDLVSRLRRYAAESATADEADLLLALCRLDVTTATDDLVTELQALEVPVQLQRTAPSTTRQADTRMEHVLLADLRPMKLMRRSAGELVLGYLADPLVDPGLRLDADRGWLHRPFRIPGSLSDFPARLRNDAFAPLTVLVLPSWTDAALLGLRPAEYSDHQVGGLALQLSRSAAPLSPGAAMNLLSVCRSAEPWTAAVALASTHLAWERGLLRPGVADAGRLDWSGTPRNLAALARVLVDLAGLDLLPVVWPVLDQLLVRSASEPRMLSGTADLLDAVAELLPSVLVAVEQGRATPDALALPGVRAFAARSGTAKAVTTARSVAAQLPVVPVTTPVDPPTPEALPESWPPAAGSVPLLDDGVDVRVTTEPRGATTRLCFTLTLPGRPGRVFEVRKGWTYDLQTESQCSATEVDTTDTAWLRWDPDRSAVVASAHRDWRRDKNGPLTGPRPHGPLPQSFVTVVIGLLGQEDTHDQAGFHALRSLIADDLLGSAAVRRAMQVLLPQDVLSPARMITPLAKDRRLLPILWPLLTESVATAGRTTGPLPRWLNRVLDVVDQYRTPLTESARRGLLPPEAARWPGLAELADHPGSSAAVQKARALMPVLLGPA